MSSSTPETKLASQNLSSAWYSSIGDPAPSVFSGPFAWENPWQPGAPTIGLAVAGCLAA